MDDCTVHVVILNWNGRSILGPCLDSLQKVVDPPLDIIVVDNGSTDSSQELVRMSYPGVELIENGENLLFARGNNIGIEAAMSHGARFILLLNNDTEVDPGFASEMLRAFDDPSVGIVGPKILFYDDPGRIWYGGGGFSRLTGVPFHRNIRSLDGESDDNPGETEWVTGCALMARREVFEGTGMLDPYYTIYCEDVDFCLRAASADWSILYEPAARVWHKVSSSSGGGMTPFKLENRIVSTWRLFARHRPLWWRILLFPIHAAVLAGLSAGFLMTGKWALLSAILKGAARAAGMR